jgi:hypothetical protein
MSIMRRFGVRQIPIEKSHFERNESLTEIFPLEMRITEADEVKAPGRSFGVSRK